MCKQCSQEGGGIVHPLPKNRVSFNFKKIENVIFVQKKLKTTRKLNFNVEKSIKN